MSGRVIYMNIPAARGEKEESFEERRIIDYLAAYRATGRPPAPCPPQPTDNAQRAALGLPLLFEPYSEVEGAVNGVASSVPQPPSVNFSAQAFSQTKLKEYDADTFFQTIVAQPVYSGHSPEELRVEAYRLGKKFSDVPQEPQPQPLVQSQAQRPPLLPAISLRSTQSAPADSLQSVNSMPPYDQHSFEELRLAYVRAGRPLSSAEIVAQNATLKLSK